MNTNGWMEKFNLGLLNIPLLFYGTSLFRNVILHRSKSLNTLKIFHYPPSTLRFFYRISLFNFVCFVRIINWVKIDKKRYWLMDTNIETSLTCISSYCSSNFWIIAVNSRLITFSTWHISVRDSLSIFIPRP